MNRFTSKSESADPLVSRKCIPRSSSSSVRRISSNSQVLRTFVVCHRRENPAANVCPPDLSYPVGMPSKIPFAHGKANRQRFTNPFLKDFVRFFRSYVIGHDCYLLRFRFRVVGSGGPTSR